MLKKPETKKVTPPNDSIHPRVVNGRTKFKKVNTTKDWKPESKAKLIAALQGHTKRHPRDGVSMGRLGRLLAGGR